MYCSFTVKGFRNLSDVSLKNLKHTNVIIGMNNVGKTALLEALFLHIGPMNPLLTDKIAQFRGMPTSKQDAEVLWGPLFFGYDIRNTIELDAEYSDGTHASLSISVKRASTIVIPQAQAKLPRELIGTTDTLTSDSLQYKYKHGSTSITRTMTVIPPGFNVNPPITKNPLPGFFISARYIPDPTAYAQRLGDLMIKRMDHHIVDTLRLVDERIKSLSVIPISGIPVIHVDMGGLRPMPIQLSGEGMARISTIAIDLVSAPKGIVLIDDIGSGIHHTVMPMIWKAISNLANKFDIQVFTTTHSAECLQSAHEYFKKTKRYDMKVFRLQRIDDRITVISYDRDTLEAAIETGLEVR